MAVAEHIRGIGYEEFLPLNKVRKRWSDRVKEMESPLFPGYLFCRCDLQNRLPVLKIPGVIQIVGNNRQPTPVDEAEISAIQCLVKSGIPNQPWPFLEVGERVRIEAGPLRGHEGVLVELRGNRRLILSVTLLQRSIAVEMDAASVQPERYSGRTRIERAYAQPLPLPLSGG